MRNRDYFECSIPVRVAFTVPEMLAVIAIVIILVALLLPSLGTARSTARSTICLSNVRQIAVAHTAYKVDNLGWHPPTSDDVSERHWLELMEDYHEGNDQIRFCPEVRKGYMNDDPPNSGLNQLWGSFEHHWWLNKNTYGVQTANGGSYGANSWLHCTTGWGNDIKLHFRRNSMIDRSANLVPVVTESVWHNGFPKHTDTSLVKESYGSQAPGGQMTRVLIRRHFGDSINVGLYDCSARRMELPTMWSLIWNKAFVTQDQVNVAWLK